MFKSRTKKKTKSRSEADERLIADLSKKFIASIPEEEKIKALEDAWVRHVLERPA